jgi:hypothetical protein
MLTMEDRKKGAQTNRERAREAHREARAKAKRFRHIGLTYAGIASHLNATGFKTRQGRRWTKELVWQLLRRPE